MSLCEDFPNAQENLEKIALMRHRQLNWVRRDAVFWRRSRKEMSYRRRGIQPTINPIYETQSNSEISEQSCDVNDLEAEKNSPEQYIMPTGINRGDCF